MSSFGDWEQRNAQLNEIWKVKEDLVRGEVNDGWGEGRAAGSTVRQGGSSRQAAPLTDPPTILFLVMCTPSLPHLHQSGCSSLLCLKQLHFVTPKSLFQGIKLLYAYIKGVTVIVIIYHIRASHAPSQNRIYNWWIHEEEAARNELNNVSCTLKQSFLIILSNSFSMLSNDQACTTPHSWAF